MGSVLVWGGSAALSARVYIHCFQGLDEYQVFSFLIFRRDLKESLINLYTIRLLVDMVGTFHVETPVNHYR